jgi:hypothetical protein
MARRMVRRAFPKWIKKSFGIGILTCFFLILSVAPVLCANILWRNSTTGQNVVYYMNGVTVLSGAYLPTVDTAWTFAGTADFNADGKPDLLWRNSTTGQNVVYYMNGVTVLSGATLPTVGSAWTLAGAADFNADSKPDLLWRNQTTGQNVVYYMNGVTIQGSYQLSTVPAPWQIVGTAPAAQAGPVVANHLVTANFNSIPSYYINVAKSSLHIAYGHTSHGSQLISGMSALASANSLYSWNDGGTGGALDLQDYAMGGDVGYYPDWVNNTRTYLGTPNSSTGRGTTNPDVNVIIWSWCGQASSKTQQTMISEYLAPMTQLEADYPGIKFVYMTGHLDGSGETGDLNVRNQQIRDYCTANNKILFDFADIESYAPNGTTNYMPLSANDNCDYSGGNWATTWIAAHPGNELTTLANSFIDCAHSQTLNCVMKARTVWWLWARLAGWDGNF